MSVSPFYEQILVTSSSSDSYVTVNQEEVLFEHGAKITANKKALFHVPSNGRYSEYTWKVPNNVKVIYVTAVGAGGSGSYATIGDPNSTSGKGGCAGASHINVPVFVTPKETITLIVGSGGQPNSSGNDTHASIQTSGDENNIIWEYDWYDRITSKFQNAVSLTEVDRPDNDGYDTVVITSSKIIVARGGCGGDCADANHKRYRCGHIFSQDGGILGEAGSAGVSIPSSSVSYEDNLGGRGGSSAFYGSGIHSYLESPYQNVTQPTDPSADPTSVSNENNVTTINAAYTKIGNGGQGGTTTKLPQAGGDGYILLMW